MLYRTYTTNPENGEAMNIQEEIKIIKEKIDRALQKEIDEITCPEILKKAMTHSLLSGGKRLRPLIVIGANKLFEPSPLNPMPLACAVEFIHTYSLIHDDLPAMDNDTMRRGVPTCHIAFGEDIAILAGDGLLTEAFRILSTKYSSCPTLMSRIIAEISTAAGCSGMVGGQILDVTLNRTTTKENLEESLHKLHRMKTGALLKACFVAGAITGGANDNDLQRLEKCGQNLGLGFQIIDDYLDTTESTETLGKDAGSDAREGKQTFIDLLGPEKAKTYAMKLKEEAITLLSPYGKRAEMLKEIIRTAIERHF